MTDQHRRAATLPPVQENAYGHVIEALGKLLRATPDKLDDTIDGVLTTLARMSTADRAYLFTYRDGFWSSTHEYCGDGIESVKSNLQDLPIEQLVDAPGAFLQGEAMQIPSVSDMPDGPLRASLIEKNVQSLTCMPLIIEAQVLGLVGLDRVSDAQPFADTDLWMLSALSDGLASVLARRAAETALSQSRAQQNETLERLRATLAAMPELVLEFDENERCIDLHYLTPELLARPLEMILGYTLDETLPPDIAQLQRDGMKEARRMGTAKVGPYALGTGESKRWYSLTIATRAQINGRNGYVFRIQDVTQEHARDTEIATLAQLTQRMTNLAVVLEPDMTIRWVNPAYEARTGYSLDELRGNPLGEFIDETSDPAETARVYQAIESLTPCQAEVCRTDRYGNHYCVAIDLQLLRLADGTIDGFMMIETDITQHKLNEIELERLAQEAQSARQHLLDAINAMPDGFAFFDADGRLSVCNQPYLDMLDGSIEVQLGFSFDQILEAAIASGNFPDALENPDEWRAERLAAYHRADDEAQMRLSDGRWIRAFECATPDGGRVALRIDITARKEAEERLNDIIDAANIGTWEYDVATRTSSINDNWASFLGLNSGSVSEVDRNNWPIYVHPDEGEKIRQLLQSIQGGEKSDVEHELRLRHQDGHWVHVLTRGRVVSTDANGRPQRISGVGVDVTDRRHAEHRLRDILRATSVGTWSLDFQTGAMMIDDLYAEMLGYDLDELTPWNGEKFKSFVHPEDFPGILSSATTQYAENRDDAGHEFRIRHRDGHWVWVLSQARVTRWLSPGTPAEESGVHIDISEQKTRQAALQKAQTAMEEAVAAQRDSEQRFADIASVSDAWFWEIGAGGKIIHISSGFERMTGLSVDRLTGESIYDHGFSSGSSNTQGDWRGLSRRIAKRATISDFLFQITLHSDRPPLWLRVSGAPYFKADGSYAGYRGVGSDVSELIAATERAEAASHAKSRFLATMSHELRTPLTGVLGMAELLSDTRIDDRQRDMIDTIRDSGEGLLTIVNDVLDLAKIEAGKMTVERNDFAPSECFRQVRALYAPRAHAAGLTLSFDTSRDCENRRVGDANRIQQILNNLVGNAIKFTTQGAVTICSEIIEADHGAYLQFTVSDTGIGMSPEQAEKVFEEFEQAERSTARRFGGTGLGLSITRHLVTLLGGTINLQTELGEGTQVTVSLPITAAEDMSHLSQTEEIAPNESLAGLRILVADDNRANRMILNAMLSGLGIEVVLAEDGLNAVELYKIGAFDLVLLDISMPGLDGVGALRAIRHSEAECGANAVPALAVTANAMQHQIDEYLAAGFDGHVSKPFRKPILIEALSRYRAAGA